jgi:hypothetical protein
MFPRLRREGGTLKIRKKGKLCLANISVSVLLLLVHSQTKQSSTRENRARPLIYSSNQVRNGERWGMSRQQNKKTVVSEVASLLADAKPVTSCEVDSARWLVVASQRAIRS